jgi:hypothetical protein
MAALPASAPWLPAKGRERRLPAKAAGKKQGPFGPSTPILRCHNHNGEIMPGLWEWRLKTAARNRALIPSPYSEPRSWEPLGWFGRVCQRILILKLIKKIFLLTKNFFKVHYRKNP